MSDDTFKRADVDETLQQFWAGNNAKGKKGFQPKQTGGSSTGGGSAGASMTVTGTRGTATAHRVTVTQDVVSKFSYSNLGGQLRPGMELHEVKLDGKTAGYVLKGGYSYTSGGEMSGYGVYHSSGNGLGRAPTLESAVRGFTSGPRLP